MEKELLHIPKGWHKVALGDCIVERKKSRVKVDDAAGFGSYPFFTSGEGVLMHDEKLTEGENIYLSTGGNAVVKYYDGEAAYSTDTYVVTGKEHLTTKYLYYAFDYLIDYINTNYFQGSGLKHLKKKDLKRHEIVIPNSVEEQQRIANALTQMDDAINSSSRLIAKYEQVKRGLMHDLLTFGIDQDGNIRSEQTHQFKDSPIGRIPVEWEVVDLETVTSEIEDCPHSTPNYINHGILVARTTCIKNGKYLIAESSYVSEEEYKQRISRIQPRSGDIIFTREAPVGEAFVIPKGMTICLGQRVMCLRCNIRMLPHFLVLNIYADFMEQQYRSVVGGTTVSHLNVSEVRRILLLRPDIEEQKRILKRIEEIDNILSSQKEKNINLSAARQGLLSDLITGKVRI